MNQSNKGRIGGVFAPEVLPAEENGLFQQFTRPGDDLRHMMSGRCGIMLGIQDWMTKDNRRVAYLPAYTCETVSHCFVKSGYRILYYDLDRDLTPLYDNAVLDEISLFLACGYFGFATYSEEFAQQCRNRGIGVLVDATHSIFTQGGISASAHYMAASLRKWLPVACGGVALKRDGDFAVSPAPLHQQHLTLRYAYLDQAAEMGRGDMKPAQDVFWDAELLLREIYEAQESDEASIETVTHYPIQPMIKKRRENYAALLAAFPQSEMVQPVFRVLGAGDCPSHFPIYCKNREALKEALEQRRIHATIYWPVPPFIEIEHYPGAKWIYDHIMALPCDHRYGPGDMERIAAALREITA